MKQLITLQNPLITTKTTQLSPLISPTHYPNPNTHLKDPIFFAKWAKKLSGSQKSSNNKLIFNAITAVASGLKILPEPLDSLVKQFFIVSSGGGNGGKIGFKNRFGGGGGNGGRRNGGKKLGFWGILVISTSLTIWLILERKRVSNFREVSVFFGNLFVVSYCLWRREFIDRVFGFFCGAALMGLLFRDNRDLTKFVNGFLVNSKRTFKSFF